MRRPGVPQILTNTRVLVVWAVLLVVLAGGVLHLDRQRRHDDRDARAGAAAVAAITTGIPPILSYSWTTIDRDLAAAERLLTGRFKTNFTKLGKDLVAPTAKRDKVTTDATALSAGLVSSTADKAVTLVFISQSTKGASMTKPRVSGARLRVTLVRVNGHWLVSDLKPV